MPAQTKETPSALRSIIAGSTAGAVEIGMSSPSQATHTSSSSANASLQLLLTLQNVCKVLASEIILSFSSLV